jgi:mediator of RNA polymerase II transcription subunit 13
MKASDLARPALRSANLHTPSSAGTASPLTTNPPRVGLSGAGNPQQSYDSLILYELFTASIVALISYHLVKDQNAVSLNYRTFLSKSPAVHSDDSGDSDNWAGPGSAEKSLYLTNVSVYWASNGTLLVSSFSAARPGIHSLDEATSPESQKALAGRCIRIAPSGTLAKLVSFDNPLDRAIGDTDRLPPKKRVRTGPAAQGIEKWKSAVTRWLLSQGYPASAAEGSASWVSIYIPHLNRHGSREVLWPRSLCFYYDNGEQDDCDPISINAGSKDPLEWFASSQTNGYMDPVDAAQQWFFGQGERDRALEARRQAQKAEEEALRLKEDVPATIFPSSPLNVRNNAYDHQSASGVYPTPPDGIAPGAAVSHSEPPNIPSTTAGAISVPGGTNPTINLSGPQDNLVSDSNPTTTSPDFPMNFDNYNLSTGNDGLFEDMDEDDDFGANGVTDADFNFFDEPDGGEVEMTDAPPEEKGDHSISAKMDEAYSEPAAPSAPQTEGIGTGTALNNPPASISEPVPDDTEANTDMWAESTHPEAIKSGSASRPPVLVELPSPTLAKVEPSLARISRAISKAPKSTAKPKQGPVHRDSIFSAIGFDGELELSDEKYFKGRFNFPRKQSQTKEGNVDSARKSLAGSMGYPAELGIRRIQSLAIEDDDDGSSVSSATSSCVEADMDDMISLQPEPVSAGIVGPGKRRLPTDGNTTPMSVTSFAESLGGDNLDLVGFYLDETSLPLLEPSPWDWSLLELPPPVEVQASTGRYNIPAFSPIVSSLPSTPTSQTELPFEPPEERPLSKSDVISVVQVITDQIVSATLDLFREGSSTVLDRAPPMHMAALQRTVKSLFPKAVQCSVSGLMSIADVYPEVALNAKGQQRPPPRRPNEGPALPGSHVLPLQPPMVRMRRADQLWEFLPPALAFWETLGLAPCGAVKNVASICIYPESESLKPCLRHFFINLRIAYEGCKLGNHEQAHIQPDYPEGFVPWAPPLLDSARAAFNSLRDTCIALGKALNSRQAEASDEDAPKTDAFVIYMVNPFKEPTAIWELCSAFWYLFQAYKQGPSVRWNLAIKPDLVLQIVPVEYIASFDVPVVHSASTYASLAREVYDRCPPSAPADDKSPLSIYSAPSFQLEEAIPRKIEFKLIPEPPQDMLRENSYIHVGYALSLDGSWLTCAWTDSSGKSRTVISYHLGTRAFRDIAKEIWQTTIDICQVRKVTWRLCIVKCGAMDREELEVWHYFSTLNTPVNFFITLLTVNPSPPLMFTPSGSTSSTQTNKNPQPSANTPTSTPNAGVSPDPQNLTPAPTPAADNTADPSNDPDTRLIDVTDETWGVILAHRLHNTNSTVEFRPCLISGLLVKRGLSHQATVPELLTPDPEQGPVVVGVNILWISTMTARTVTSPFPAAADGISPGGQGNSPSPSTERERMSLMWTPTPQHRSTAESVLKEILVQFRNLGTLARLKGIRGCRMGTVPWHVAVAKRGAEKLAQCFPTS